MARIIYRGEGVDMCISPFSAILCPFPGIHVLATTGEEEEEEGQFFFLWGKSEVKCNSACCSLLAELNILCACRTGSSIALD
jgi:hypothetical protein